MSATPSHFRVELLPTATCDVVTVTRDTSVAEATTTMLLRDFSQLPVMNGQGIVGLFSWKSHGEAVALGRSCGRVGECMAPPPPTVSPNDSLLEVVPRIAAGDVAVVVEQGKLRGIITTSDLSVEFRRTIRPFVLLESIQNGLRSLAGGVVVPADLAAIRARPALAGAPADLEQLTLRELLQLFTAPTVWGRLGTSADAAAFRGHLDRVREIRNAVMHHRAGALREEDFSLLESVERAVRVLRAHCGAQKREST